MLGLGLAMALEMLHSELNLSEMHGHLLLPILGAPIEALIMKTQTHMGLLQLLWLHQELLQLGLPLEPKNGDVLLGVLGLI